MRDIDDIVEEEIIAKIDNVLTVSYASEVVNQEQTVRFCDMKYLRLYLGFVMGNNGYSIISIDGEEVTVTVFDGIDPLEVGNQVTIERPFYFRGTPKAVNSEWKAFSDNEMDKLPMVWLVNPVEEEFFRNDPKERRSDIRLFILCLADFENDLTKNFREKNITPLLALAKEINNAINKNPSHFNKLNSYRTRDFSKFGVEDRTGIVKYIIDSNLSGVDMRFDLETLTENCNC